MRSIKVDNDSCSITFCGDTSLGDYYMKWNGDAVYQRLRLDPGSFFEGLRPVVGGSHILIVNLETCLLKTGGNPLKGKWYPARDDPDRTIAALSELGVTGVNLANNHAMDLGPEALDQSISRLRIAGFGVLGAGLNEEMSSQPLVERVEFGARSKCIYVLGAYEVKRRYKEWYQYYATSSSPGINPLYPRRLRSQIERLRKYDPDALIIVCPHWYLNYQWAGKWHIDLCSSMISAGADLIIGHGLHMLGQCHWEQGGTQVLSLGNFVFNSPGSYQKFSAPPFSLIARIDICPELVGWSAALTLYPIISDNRRTDFRPEPVGSAMLPKVYSLLTAYSPQPASFNASFQMGEDDRGPHIFLTQPISPRFQNARGRRSNGLKPGVP